MTLEPVRGSVRIEIVVLVVVAGSVTVNGVDTSRATPAALMPDKVMLWSPDVTPDGMASDAVMAPEASATRLPRVMGSEWSTAVTVAAACQPELVTTTLSPRATDDGATLTGATSVVLVVEVELLVEVELVEVELVDVELDDVEDVDEVDVDDEVDVGTVLDGDVVLLEDVVVTTCAPATFDVPPPGTDDTFTRPIKTNRAPRAPTRLVAEGRESAME